LPILTGISPLPDYVSLKKQAFNENINQATSKCSLADKVRKRNFLENQAIQNEMPKEMPNGRQKELPKEPRLDFNFDLSSDRANPSENLQSLPSGFSIKLDCQFI
jgi:hypothetical protein